MTGLYPPAHGATTDKSGIPNEISTLAEQLAAENYRTAAFTGGGWVSSDYGFDQGFSVFDSSGKPTTLAERVSKATTWLRTRSPEEVSDPFFLFLHAYDPHDPYSPKRRPTPEDDFIPPPVLQLAPRLFKHDLDLTPTEAIVTAFTYPVQKPGMGHGVRQSLDTLSDKTDPSIEERWQQEEDFEGAVRWLRANYDAEVAELDRSIANLWTSLETEGLLEDTVIVLVSDHGEAFMEHGRLEHRHVDRPVVHVPLIVWLPERLRSDSDQRRVDEVVSGVDLLPTILDYAGRKVAEVTQGRTLRELIVGEATPPVPALSFVDVETLGNESSLRFGAHRLVVGGPRDPDMKGMLFDAIADTAETSELSATEPELHQKMLRMLEHLRDQSVALGTQFGPNRVNELDPETRRRLIQLGYLAPGR